MTAPTLEDLHRDMTEAIAELKAASEAAADERAEGVDLQQAIATTTVTTAYSVLRMIEHLQASAAD